MRLSGFSRRIVFATTIAALSLATAPAAAGEITVVVSGADGTAGEIGCALYAGADGFPMDPSTATQQWLDVRDGGAECRFEGLPPGQYAVAVSHDLNGNRQTDTNFLGIPKEAWGVSNNVRPTLRAPTFEEAAVALAEGAALKLDVEVAK